MICGPQRPYKVWRTVIAFKEHVLIVPTMILITVAEFLIEKSCHLFKHLIEVNSGVNAKPADTCWLLGLTHTDCKQSPKNDTAAEPSYGTISQCAYHAFSLPNV
jgi:hypothetical protein